MSWVKIDDRLTEHPKIVRAGPEAIVLQVRALCYCARNLTDGRVPREVVGMMAHDLIIAGAPGTAESAGALMVSAGLWDPADHPAVSAGAPLAAGWCPAGWVVHDYLVYNPSGASSRRAKKVRESLARNGGLSRARSAQRLTDGTFATSSSTSRTPSRAAGNGIQPTHQPNNQPTHQPEPSPEPEPEDERLFPPKNNPPTEGQGRDSRDVARQASPDSDPYVVRNDGAIVLGQLTSCARCASLFDVLNRETGARPGHRCSGRGEQMCHELHSALGYSPEQIESVIRRKVAQWKADRRYARNLRPLTLFEPAKFDSYLNEADAPAEEEIVVP